MHGPTNPKFYVLFVCKCVLPPGDNPTAVNKYIISYFLKSSSGTPASPPALLEIEDDDPDDTPIVKEVSRPLKNYRL
jgi:hypothetical protein